ncbi:MAG: 2-amino-4-hydroxy-6-hydroxymethyldihydropteridine diphosphokinase [Rhodocyclales bacterium]|nr:2-amino-4-hydroxy-6-hydroxymethyldihydropteridine diphosphokinase [Rhodocyclales bacterium]
MSASFQGTRAARAFIAFGANLGDPGDAYTFAQAQIAALPDTRIIALSALYRTAPVGVSGQPDYINAVLAIDTRLTPEALLEAILAIEQRRGRTRASFRAPRTLDLDLLLYEERVITTPRLELPHPRMHKRAFVLIPLAEIAPDTHIPGYGPVSALLTGVADQSVTRIRTGISGTLESDAV